MKSNSWSVTQMNHHKDEPKNQHTWQKICVRGDCAGMAKIAREPESLMAKSYNSQWK